MLEASNCFWQRATNIIVGWLQTVHTKITVSGIPTCLNYCNFYGIYIIHKCGHGLDNTTWQVTCGHLTEIFNTYLKYVHNARNIISLDKLMYLVVGLVVVL